MVRFKRIVIGVMIVAIGIGVVIYFFPSEEKRIRKQFRLLAIPVKMHLQWPIKSKISVHYSMERANLKSLFIHFQEVIHVKRYPVMQPVAAYLVHNSI